MSKKEWGNATWYLFHTLAEKLKPQYSGNTPEVFHLIQQICKNLPCPDCQEHAIKTLRTVNSSNIRTRENLIDFIWQFHNKVNARLNKPIFSELERDKLYKKAITMNVINHFIQVMNKRMGNERGMLNAYYRSKCVGEFVQYMNNNLYKFNN